MATITVPNRPFSSELITGLALPDGVFETTLGAQRINAHFKNQGFAALSNVNVYVESVSDPGIVITPQTYPISSLANNASRLLFWQADFSMATPGAHRISFIAEDASGRTRVIKKIFVTRVTFDPGTKTFSAQTPEGTMQVRFRNFIGTKNVCCHRKPGRDRETNEKRQKSFLDVLRNFASHDPDFQLCLRPYLLKDLEIVTTPNPPYSGQFGDLPFQDPWWKILLCIIALLLLVAAAIAEAVDGSGEVSTTGGPGGSESPSGDCCGLAPSGGGTSYVAAGLVAAAAGVATAAGFSDVRDPFRRGQDNTEPAGGEITTAEHLVASLSYPEPVRLGRPFAVKAEWKYTRQTTGASYDFAVSETNNNIHVLSKYEIQASDVVRLYKEEPFIVRAQFFGPDDRLFRGEELFVQCLLIGPAGEYRRFVLQDDGIFPDEKPGDGIYTGMYFFERERNPRGIWTYFVIAQDINSAQPDMSPEEAAQIIGGMVLTHQLTISFSGGICPLVPDGHVNVI